MTDILELAKRVEALVCTGKAKVAYQSINGQPQNWSIAANHAGRIKPYPMGFDLCGKEDHEKRLYWAQGWGTSVYLFPWERWAIRRAALRAKEATNG